MVYFTPIPPSLFFGGHKDEEDKKKKKKYKISFLELISEPKFMFWGEEKWREIATLKGELTHDDVYEIEKLLIDKYKFKLESYG